MQDMNQPHNPNKYAPTPEKTVEQIRHEALRQAVLNSERAYDINLDPAITVTEVPAQPIATVASSEQSNNISDIHNRIEAAYSAPQTTIDIQEQVVANNVVQLQSRPQVPLNTLPIDEIYYGEENVA